MLHQQIVSSIPATSQVVVPLDAPIHDVTLGTSILPSQFQKLLIDELIPSLLIAVQAVVEESLPGRGFKSQIESLVGSGKVSRAQASECHHWRFVRNAIAHSAGVIDQQLVDEFNNMKTKGEVLFTAFRLHGRLLDAGQGGVPVPLSPAVAADPRVGGASVPIVVGQSLSVGVGDLLGSGVAYAVLL